MIIFAIVATTEAHMGLIQDFTRASSKVRVARQAAVYRALSEPLRITLLCVIAEGKGNLAVEGLVVGLAKAGYVLTQPTISHHLHILHENGLVVKERRGTRIYYSLNLEDDVMQGAQLLLREVRLRRRVGVRRARGHAH